MRRRPPAPPELSIPEPPAFFEYAEWEDPARPSREFLDGAYLRAIRRWLDARLDFRLAQLGHAPAPRPPDSSPRRPST